MSKAEEDRAVLLAKRRGTYPDLTPDLAMAGFYTWLRDQMGDCTYLDPKEAAVLRVAEQYRWLPSQIRLLSNRDWRLLLHKDWRAYLLSIDDLAYRDAVREIVRIDDDIERDMPTT